MRGMEARERRRGATGREQQANEQLLRRELSQPIRKPDCCMYAGKVHKRCSGQNGAATPDGHRHASRDENSCDCGRCARGRNEHVPAPPMEVVSLAQCAEITGLNCMVCIEQAIAHVRGPCSTCDEQRNPGVQPHTGRPRKCERPHNSDRGCIETCEMPEMQYSRRLPPVGWSECTGVFALWLRFGQGKSHCFDCKRSERLSGWRRRWSRDACPRHFGRKSGREGFAYKRMESCTYLLSVHEERCLNACEDQFLSCFRVVPFNFNAHSCCAPAVAAHRHACGFGFFG